ncbi:hypothetical protein [Tumebacillus permanentifrigoris]|uniref:Uncharacterized protein n=1 Tax=Tumebacillus permanentifrigoris TaxID=378543 RepID=A0A316D8Y0_9BACL|nr:hypothetical protein [Tumebacillus permanentifrigoris]PWK11535.1 hypothetical protein C7459_11064 [Tumebacillus permanentifrigoris]
MQNSRSYPFERNRYFYGKLLTVRDFESEQTYMNQKRWLLNRLLHGVGVVTGLQVTPAGERKITVNSGLAFDYQGREIIIDERQTLDLSTVKGFQNNGDYAKIVYLCLKYDETGKEMVHSVANTGRKEEVSEYNRMVESYSLLIKEELPPAEQFDATNLSCTTSLLHEDRDVRILHQVPRFVQANDRFQAKLLIQRISQQRHVRLELHPAGNGCVLEQETKQGDKLVFEKEFADGEYNVEYLYTLRALQPAPGATEGTVSMKTSDVQLFIAGHEVSVTRSVQHTFTVTYDSIAEQLLQKAYSRSLDDVLTAPNDQCLYLAQIHLQPFGSSYKVDSIVPVPFFEQVHNPSMLFNLGTAGGSRSGADSILDVQAQTQAIPADQPPHLDVNYDRAQKVLTFTLGLPEVKPIEPPKTMTTGTTDFFLLERNKPGIFGKAERSYVTDEITHGLGAGPVLITVGLEASESLLPEQQSTIYGDADAFQGTEFATELPKHTIGTLVYPHRGTFRIGVRLLEPAERGSLRVRWWAHRADAQSVQELAQPKLEAAAGTSDGHETLPLD